jgi:hypothetical protein
MNATVWSAQLVVPVLPNRDHIRGPAFARVTLLEYCDYEGPYCSVAHAIINRIQTQLQSQIRFVFRHFPITTAHSHAHMTAEAAEAAEAAGSQGKFSQMHSALFVTESPLTNSALADSEAAIGLNMASFQDEIRRYNARLDNALMPGHDVAQRVIKLERDQQGHDLAEYGLEHPVLQRIQRTKYQRAHHRNGQPIQGDENVRAMTRVRTRATALSNR